MKLHRSIAEPIRRSASWDQLWSGADQGLIACWERGREKIEGEPEIAKLAREGRLVVLPWKGGVERATKGKRKIGTLSYLAMWQGLRGNDLDIDLDCEITMTCAKTGVTVLFTNDFTKYANADQQ